MKALKTYWGNLSGKRASAAKGAHETSKGKLPGAQQHEAKMVGKDAAEQQGRLAKVTKEEAEWPRTVAGKPHKGKKQLAGRKNPQTYGKITRRKGTLEKQIAGGELIGKGAKDARANLGSVQSEIGAAGEAARSAAGSRRTTRIATAVGAGVATAGGGGYAYGKKKGYFEARLERIELALPQEAGVDPRIVQKVIQDATIMQQEGQTRVAVSRQLFQQLQLALQQFYGNAKQVDKMFEAEQALIELGERIDDAIELGSGGIAALGRKAKGIYKGQLRSRNKAWKASDTWLGKSQGSPQAAKHHAAAGQASRDRAEALNRRKGRIVSKQGAAKIARGGPDARRGIKTKTGSTGYPGTDAVKEQVARKKAKNKLSGKHFKKKYDTDRPPFRGSLS